MASVHVLRTALSTGAVRYRVRFRLGGRETPHRYAGSFGTRKEAEARARWVAGELAARRVPDLRPLEELAREVPTLAAFAERWIASRLDTAPNSTKTYRQAFRRLGRLGDLEPAAVRTPDVQEWVAGMVEDGLAPSTVRKYLDALRGALDAAEVEPNPARSRRLSLPRIADEEVSPPSRAEVDAILATITPRYRLHVRLLEGTGLRVGELSALTWGDIDAVRGRLRVARGRTKGGTAGRRWIPLPPGLLEAVGALRAPEDRDVGAPVLPGWTDDGLRNAMIRACRFAEIAVYSPHDLRHRYISRLVLAGVPLPLVRQVVGHARASVTLDVYSHALLNDPDDDLDGLRRSVVALYDVAERAPRGSTGGYIERAAQTRKPVDTGLSSLMEDTGLEPVTSTLPV